jgi:hypothetical protein
MNASSICSRRFDLGAEVRAAAHQAILIFTSSEGALLQAVFITSVGICVDILKVRCPATLAKMESAYWNAFRKIDRIAFSIIETLARCLTWVGQPFVDKP